MLRSSPTEEFDLGAMNTTFTIVELLCTHVRGGGGEREWGGRGKREWGGREEGGGREAGGGGEREVSVLVTECRSCTCTCAVYVMLCAREMEWTHRDTGTQRYRDTGTQEHGDMGTWGHGDMHLVLQNVPVHVQWCVWLCPRPGTACVE